ncbi:MAG: TIR domain-containing protein, partial [Ktedonobacterales bacterium]
MAGIFISYSRQNRDFVVRLQEALVAAGRDVWVDLKDIPPMAEWQREIDTGIAAADTVIAVLSPEYFASAMCMKEVERAVEYKKRIVPLVCQQVSAAEAPAALAVLNWIFVRPTDDFAVALEQLRLALDIDLAYWHQAADILVRARRWDGERRNASFTLRGSELAEAERWLGEGVEKQPSPTALQTHFITASRRGATSRQRRLIGALSIGLVITLVLSIVAVSQTLVAQAKTLEAQNKSHDLFTRTLAGKANDLLFNNHVDQALLLSVLATRRKDLSGAGTTDANDALLNALEYSPRLQTILQGPPPTPTDVTNYPIGQNVAFSADGRTLLSARGDGEVRLWDGATGKALRQIDAVTALKTAALSPDGSMVATRDYSNHGDGLQLWNASTGQRLGVHLAITLTNSGPTNALDSDGPSLLFTPDSKTLAFAECVEAACAHGQIAFFDVATGTALGAIPLTYPPNFTALAFSPDGQSLAVGECDGPGTCNQSVLTLWHVAARTKVWSVAFAPASDGYLQTVAFSADGLMVATGSCADINCDRGQAELWDAAMGVPDPALFEDHTGGISAIAFSPDGQTLLTGANHGTLQLWNVASRTPIGASLRGNSDGIVSVAFSADGRHFASASADTHILLWRTTPYTDSSLALGPDLDGASQVAFSPNSKTMATASCDGVIRLWDVATGRRVALLSDPTVPADCLFALAFSPDGTLLAVGSDYGYGYVWNLTTKQLTISCTCEQGNFDSVAISPDDHYLVTVGDDQSDISLWDLSTRQLVYDFASTSLAIQRGAAFSPDGRILVVGDVSGQLVLWDMRAGKENRTLT